MAYHALVIPVMIASPGDVDKERRIVREVLHEWNDVNANQRGIMLAPVGWETHSAPSMGGRPQALINASVLAQCDLLIGVFWTRLGTPTGESASGTVEEIEEHIGQGKPAMLYFSSVPVKLDSVDRSQYESMVAFRDSCKPRGLVEHYETVGEFREKLTRQVQQAMYQDPHLTRLIQGSEQPAISSEITLRSLESMSTDARELLMTAAKGNGTIVRRRTIGTSAIQSGGRSFGAESSRDFAKWEAALNTLIDDGFVIDRAGRGNLFELTDLGWRLSDEV